MKILTARPILLTFLLNICVLGAVAASGPEQASSDSTSASAPAASSESSNNPEDAAKHINGILHPIKKALAPVEDLEGQGIKMEQAVMKVSGPISDLTPRMAGLDKTMNSVTDQVNVTKAQLTETGNEVCGARKDIAGMRQDVHTLKDPIYALYKPIQETEKPLNGIKTQLNIIAWAILVCGAATALGIPISCVLFWRYRAQILPKITGETPAQVAAEVKTPAGAAP